jgi:Mg-chelatase subunit ChlI
MALRIPQPLKKEHRELHGELVKGLRSGGKTERMARAVAKLLHPHFVKEEEFALPPLGLLSTVAKRRITADMSQALAMTEKLKRELPRIRGQAFQSKQFYGSRPVRVVLTGAD